MSVLRTGQAGIFALGTAAHVYLELDALAGVPPTDLVAAVADLHEPRSTVGGVNLVAGFRPDLWRSVEPGEIPADVRGFDAPLAGADGYTMPATQHDVWLWVSAASYDVAFDTARAAIAALAPVAVRADDISSWSYHHDRDLTGFVDGSANPSLMEAPAVALVPPGAPGAGGSTLLFQKWEHHAAAWEALPTAEQESVMGRTKADSLEFEPAERNPRSHVARTELIVDGVERKIFRRNTPYGGIDTFGTVFVGFAAEQDILETMLRRMAGSDDGVRDALTGYSTPLTGAYYWVPAVEALGLHATPEDD